MKNNIILKNLLKYKSQILLVVFLTCLIVFLHMLVPIMYKLIVEELTDGKNFTKIIYYSCFYFGIMILMDIFSSFKSYQFKKTSALIGFHLRKDFLKHLLKLPLAYFKDNKSGEIYTTVTSDISAVENFITSTSINILSNFLQVTITLTVLFYLNIKLTIISLCFIPITHFLLNLANKKIERASEKERAELAKANSYIQETIQGISTVRVYNLLNKMILKTIKPTRLFIKYHLKGDLLYSISANLANISFSCSVVLLFYIIGGKEVIENRLSLGDLLAFSMYLSWVTGPLISLFKIIPVYKRVKVSYYKITEVMAKNPELRGELKLAENISEIKFQNINFSYDAKIKVLENIDFTINAGESVALVGVSGSGKSTLIDLLLRNYLPKAGKIIINNENYTKFYPKSLRKEIGVVLQDSFFFNDSIKNNLKLISPNADAEMIKKVAELSDIASFIEKLPEKYETIIGERGVKLSGGQKQKLAIARLLLYDSSVYVFDEATSHLDNNSEAEVIRNINNYLKDKIKIFIAHRLSTIQNVDKILVMDNGFIVESGKHQELLQKKGLYYELWQKTIQN